MENFQKKLRKLHEKQEEHVGNIKSIIYNLLELKGASQNLGGGYVHGTHNIVPDHPEYGKEFDCATNGTGFSFTVRVQNGYVKAFGQIPGLKHPANMIMKKWCSIEKMQEEFILVFGKCFYKKQTMWELFANKQHETLS